METGKEVITAEESHEMKLDEQLKNAVTDDGNVEEEEEEEDEEEEEEEEMTEMEQGCKQESVELAKRKREVDESDSGDGTIKSGVKKDDNMMGDDESTNDSEPETPKVLHSSFSVH